MNDLIDRRVAIEAIEEDKIDLTDPNVVEVFKAIGDLGKAKTQVSTCDRHIKILKDLPPAQLEIIRCKDCKYYKTMFCAMDTWTAEITIYKAQPDDFCSRAER